jgi:hypothetical protein
MTIRLDYHPRDWQRECHTALHRFSVLALHRRAGKTELAIAELIDKALRFTKELGLFFYVAPFLKQSKAIAWARLKARVAPLLHHGAVEINEAELSITFKHNGSMIRCYGADNPDAMRGVRLDGAVLDEVAQMKPEVWYDILQPALSDRLGWAIFIGTPNGINLFSELYYKGLSTPEWTSRRYTVYDTNSLAASEVERLRRDMNEQTFAREMLCDFTAAGDDQLISLFTVETACQTAYPPGTMDYAPKILGVDPARFGDDRSVIFKRQGLVGYKPEVMHGIDNMQLAARVAQTIMDWKPDAIFIDEGNGSGVIDRLRQLGYQVIGVHFGGKASHTGRWINKRTEMWCLMAEWLQSGASIPNVTELKQDLAAPRYWYDAQDRRVLESKDDLKARGLPSPDLGDALALTFAHPVQKDTQTILEKAMQRPQRVPDYDPYARA